MSSNNNIVEIRASVPEPLPKRQGIEVTPLLIQWLEKMNMDDHVVKLIKERHLYGLEKYGQGLMTEDGRNTLEDAKQEAGDLLQYLFKARLQKTSFPPKERQALKEIMELCLFFVTTPFSDV